MSPTTTTTMRACVLLLLCSAFFSTPARAFFLPLVFDPAAPVESDVAQVLIRVGDCDLLAVANPQDRTIVVTGSTIRVQVMGFTNGVIGDICNFPRVTVTLDLVPLAAGTYNVEIYRQFTSGPPRVDLVVSGSLTVSPAPPPPPISIPTSTPWGLALIILLFVLTAIRRRTQ